VKRWLSRDTVRRIRNGEQWMEPGEGDYEARMSIWDRIESIPVETRVNIFLGILAFVAVAGFFYAIGTDVGEASVLNQACAAMCNVPESIRP
jgi:hypothetical protein